MSLAVIHPGGDAALGSSPGRKTPFYFVIDHFDHTRGIAAWLAFNAALAMVMKSNRVLGSLLAWVIIFTCLGLLMATRRLIVSVCVLGYIGCLDTVFRMVKAQVPWESAKYLLALGVLITLYRFVGRPKSTLALGIIILLLPSLVPAYLLRGPDYTRDRFSFVLMGPISMALAIMLFRRLRMNWPELRLVLITMLGPAIFVTFLASQATSKLGASDFTSLQSNVASSGGFGPNQVSALIGLGIFFSVLLMLQDSLWSSRFLFTGLAVWFFAQSVLTFSRGGISNVVLAMLLAAPHLLAHDKLALRFILAFSVFALIIGFAVLPRLDTFTGGSAEKRLQQRNTTLRGELMQTDIKLFEQNPLLGVGAGFSDFSHGAVVDPTRPSTEPIWIASHTEWTRLPAESGIFGIMVIVCLVGLVAEAYGRQPSWMGRAWTAGFVGWSIMEWTHASTRNAITGVMFGLAMVVFDEGTDASDLSADADADDGARPLGTAPRGPLPRPRG